MLINLRNALMAGKRTPTAKDYVQNGLIAMWDGIENAGWGLHDASATTWKDLIGNVNLSIYNGVFTQDAVVLTMGRIYNSSIPVLVAAVSSGSFTIEYGGFFYPRDGLVYYGESGGFKIGGYPTSSGWAGSSTSEQGSTFWSKYNFNSAGAGASYPLAYESRWGWDDSMNNHRSPTSIPSLNAIQQAGIGQKQCTVQIVGDGSECKSYVDTIFFNAALVNTQANYLNYGFALGSYLPRSNMAYNFFRLYSRALTAAEIASNYAIDKARFGLP